MSGRVFNPRRPARGPAILAVLALSAGARLAPADGPAKPQPIKHRVTGLFAPDRDADLRAAVKKIPGLELIGVDRANAEAVFSYDPATLFAGSKPERNAENLDGLLRSVSASTFGIKPLCATPRDKLTLVEIRALGLDCKGCALGAYESISGIEGVVQATVNFKEGRVTALIDPAKTGRDALEAALKQKGVELVPTRP